mgnify:CR=1 FL=1
MRCWALKTQVEAALPQVFQISVQAAGLRLWPPHTFSPCLTCHHSACQHNSKAATAAYDTDNTPIAGEVAVLLIMLLLPLLLLSGPHRLVHLGPWLLHCQAGSQQR